MKTLPILFLLVLLAACAPVVTEAPAPTETLVPTNTPVPMATTIPSHTPTPTESPEEATARLAQDVLDGNIADLSSLDEQQRLAVIEILAEHIPELAAMVIRDQNIYAELTAGWDVEIRMALSVEIVDIQQEKMSRTPVLWAERIGGTLSITPEWRGLRLIENPSSQMQERWDGKVFNPDSAYWWGQIDSKNDTGDLSMPDQLVPAFQDESGAIHYIDKNGDQIVFSGAFPSRAEIIEKMVSAHKRAQGNTKNRETIENGIVDVYAGILYESADKADIVWNIDPVAIPSKSITVLIPVWNEQGDLLYMRKLHALFTTRFYEYSQTSGGGIELRRVDTNSNSAVFFGSGHKESDVGQLVLLTGIVDRKAYSLGSMYQTNDNVVEHHPMSELQNVDSITTDVYFITLGSLFPQE